MNSVADSLDNLREDIEMLRGAIDDALDSGAGELTLRGFALLLRDAKAKLVQLERAEANRRLFRFP